jgi:hypothetical protein
LRRPVKKRKSFVKPKPGGDKKPPPLIQQPLLSLEPDDEEGGLAGSGSGSKKVATTTSSSAASVLFQGLNENNSAEGDSNDDDDEVKTEDLSVTLMGDDDEDSATGSLGGMATARSVGKKVMVLLCAPLNFLFEHTTINCEKGSEWENWYVFCFSYTSITACLPACLHSLAPHETSLTIIPLP